SQKTCRISGARRVPRGKGDGEERLGGSGSAALLFERWPQPACQDDLAPGAACLERFVFRPPPVRWGRVAPAPAPRGRMSTSLRSRSMLDLIVSSAPPGAPRAAVPFTHVQKRDGRSAPYDRDRIAHAVEMAFRAEAGVPYPDALDSAIHDSVERVTDAVENTLAAGYAEP